MPTTKPLPRLPSEAMAETPSPALPGGITEGQRAALLAELVADPTGARTKARTLTPREAVVASLMRERDHLDGCPVPDDGKASAMVEAYEERAPAPGPQLRSAGAVPGSAVVVVRCIRCAGSRYFVSTAPAHIPVGKGLHVTALIADTLTTTEPAGLDTTL